MPAPAPRPALQERVATAILAGAARLFAVEGEQASMNDVAAAVGVARATVYRYFPNRQSLLDELAHAAVSDADARLASSRIDEVAPEEGVAWVLGDPAAIRPSRPSCGASRLPKLIKITPQLQGRYALSRASGRRAFT